jgi:glutathione reductase (NADPH)
VERRELAAALKHAPYYGFDVRANGHDWSKLKRGRDAYVLRLNGIYERNLDKKGIVTVRAVARLSGAGEVVDANGEVYRAKHVMVATGGRPGFRRCREPS